jgi:DNA-binding SARP family transcriptional activator
VVVVASVGTSEQRDVDGVAIQRREAAKRCFPYGAATNLGESRHRLVAAGDHHVLEPWGWVVAPPSVSGETLEAVQAVLDDARRPLDRLAPVVPIEASSAVRFVEPEWRLLVRLLGQVEVVTADGVSVAFDRSKALELVVWLALHRERPTRSKARAALWDTAVTAATFSNVVSDARRAMARMMPPPPDSEWIARTMTEDLSLHPLVISDADVLAARVDAARRLPSFEAVEVLRPGLELVSGLPFESSCYAWPDAEGHTSSLVLLATDAAAELAGHYLSLADIDGVFWATGQGLKVLSGHEALIAMRMRAHASRGDRSGVRHEWESYERALAADSWSAADPSPKLVALRAELLSSEVWPTSSRAAGA